MGDEETLPFQASGDGGGEAAPPAPPTPEQLAPCFPQLDVLELIGTGGSGTVYKARQRTLDRLVALKILSPVLARDRAFVSRFEREARALAALTHPNIVGVHDAGHAGPHLFLLMEFVDGTNLRTCMREGSLGTSETLAVVSEVCTALQFAHDAGIVHRDIKPENILLDTNGKVKIADFGLVKVLGADGEGSVVTRSNQVMGTPQYMAPEQYETPTLIDHRADLYALGVVFYELLTGELPLGRFEVPSHKAAIDARLDEIVLRALQKDPLRRYQCAEEIKTDVARLAAEVTLHPPRAHAPRTPRFARSEEVRLKLGSLVGAFWGGFAKASAPSTGAGSIPIVGDRGREEGRTVSLVAVGPDRDGVIDALREISGCPAGRAAEVLASVPQVLAVEVSEERAQWIRARVEVFGGEVEIR